VLSGSGHHVWNRTYLELFRRAEPEVVVHAVAQALVERPDGPPRLASDESCRLEDVVDAVEKRVTVEIGSPGQNGAMSCPSGPTRNPRPNTRPTRLSTFDTVETIAWKTA
jgi:hypothetical protein